MGKKFGGGGYPTKGEARTAREIRKIEIKKGLSIGLKKKNHLNNYLLTYPEVNTKFDALKAKYHALYQDPENHLGLIFDFMMEDFDLPVRFKDIKSLAKNSNSRKNIPAAMRMKILKRDNFRCKLCGSDSTKSKIQVDHVVPVALGGITEERNLQTLCDECNMGKGDKTIISGDSSGYQESFPAKMTTLGGIESE
jgi:hypothetical protein